MTTRLILIAHAPTAAVRRAAFPADEPLDPHGLADATAAAGSLPRFDAVLCAPARRCVETAVALGLVPTVDEGLRDGDLGRWAGSTLDRVAADEPDAVAAWLTDPAAAPHGGESLADLLARTGDWLRDLDGSTRTVVAVTHPMVIRALVVTAIAATPTSFWRIDISPLTRTVLRGGADRWSLRGLSEPLD
ncbi:histidine phosphatase family protein [Micromonospora sp. NBC_01796]|uniref:histidine phosphatase family protein n=1 Tax=Micromonospora sp. NBC_01796 TaxID=2975987 RepID=UPI002DDAB272|nr:histidine phosphatase family protein [Micromonospora sp. NBC_01796]WSA84391.1 histidine phosphatase family protein [Micromonospora sp. NBC_01796]